MSASPLFSIVIPTRNRADLLRQAIESVRRQDFSDYEVIVFDNASEDATPRVVAELADPRVRFIRSEQWINVQDAYEEAFKVARGRFLHAMGDDDALLPWCLRRAKDLLEKHGTRLLCMATNACIYYYPDWIEESKRNTLWLRTPPYECRLLDSKTELQSIFELGLNYDKHPIVTNIFVRKQDIEYLQTRYGQILLNEHCGDVSLAVFLLSASDTYALTDEPLRVAGCSGRSNSAQFTKGNFSKSLDAEFRAWFSDEQKWSAFLRGVPVKVPDLFNLSMATLLQLQTMLGLPYELNWARYFKAIWQILARHRAAGVDISAAQAEFEDALRQQPMRIWLAVAPYRYTPLALQRLIKRFVRHPLLTGRSTMVISGAKEGFGDILGAIKYMERIRQ